MTKQSNRDPLLKQPKETILAMYRNCEMQRNWYERLEVLRTRGIKPVVTLTVNLGEFEDSAQNGEVLTCEVFAPNAADGGVVRVVWTTKEKGAYAAVNIEGYEAWHRATINNMHACLGARVMAERLAIAVSNLRPRIAA